MEDNYEQMGLTDADQMMVSQQELVDHHANELMENPFEDQQYMETKGSDAPIPYSGGMADLLLSNDEVPEVLRKKYWWIFNRDNTLTFLDDQTKNSKLLSYDIAIIDTLDSMDSYFDYTFKDEMQFGLMRNAFDTKLDRAKGTTGSTKNERIIIQSQFQENRNINETGQQGGPIKEGFFKRLLGRR